jgi:hypothetical protein
MVQFGVNTTPDKAYLGINPNRPILIYADYKAFGLQSRGKNKNDSKLVAVKNE